MKLSDETLAKLAKDLPDLLNTYSPHPDDSDYICSFCRERGTPHWVGTEYYGHKIFHRPYCLGVQIEKELLENG